MRNDTSFPAGGLFLAFAVLFVVSGACGLAYEVVWSRMLVTVFGVTAFAVSTVLVSFMGGMALGAALLGRRAERSPRPLRMFALLEAGIGAYGLLLPLLLELADLLYVALFRALPESFMLRATIRFALSLALLLPPTVLMGGTLPALGQGLLRRRERIGSGVGALYFVNTIGAAAGCYLAGFVLIPQLGLAGTTWLAVAGNAVVALSAWLLEARTRAARAATPPPAAAPMPVREVEPLTSPASWPLWVAFGSGMTALAFEVVWFRVLVLVFGSTVYSFAAMLSVFLLGIALGALMLGGLADRARHPLRLVVWTQAGVALFVLVGNFAVNLMPEAFLRLIHVFGLDFAGMNRTKLVLSSVSLLPAALAFGGTFPVTVRLAAVSGGTASRIGRVYAWNTVGAIVGSFGTGFLLLPTIGSQASLRLVILAALVLAFGSLLAEPGGRVRAAWAVPAGLGVVLLLAAALFAPEWDRQLLGSGAYFEPRRYYGSDGSITLKRGVGENRVIDYSEGYNDTIISYRSPVGKFITVNGSATASDQFEDMFSQRMLGHLPAAVHPGRPSRLCAIGLGAGVTAGAMSLYEIDRLVGVELEQGVFQATRFFERENHNLLEHPALEVRIDDGRSFLKLTDERFDIISSVPNFPSLTGSGSLYSRDYFELCRSRLAPGGVMVQFSPLWRLAPSELRTIVGSFVDVFPTVRVFSTGMSLVMLGREEPFPPVALDELTRRVERAEVRDSLAGIGVRGPLELLAFYRFDEDEARRLAGNAPRNTDDRPRIEFFAPRALFERTVAPNVALLRSVRLPPEQRADRLGLSGEARESFITLARGYDATLEAMAAFSRNDGQGVIDWGVPAADSGQRYARFLVARLAEESGVAHEAAGNLAAARDQYAAALHYEPQRATAMLRLGYVTLLLGRLEQAEALLEGAATLYPASAEASYRLGMVREATGDVGVAESLYRKAIELHPWLTTARADLARLLLVTGRTAAALEAAEQARRFGERGQGVELVRAEALLRLGRAEEARRTAVELAERFPDSRQALEMLARSAEAAGREQDASRARERIERLVERSGAAPAGDPPAAEDRIDEEEGS